MTPTQVKLIDEVLKPDRRREIATEITEAIMAMERESGHKSAWIIIQEAHRRRNLLRVTMNVVERS